MAQLLVPVNVKANRTSMVEVRLLAGGAVAGTVRFDDGSPDAGARMELLRQGKKGEWVDARTTQMGNAMVDNRTDDRGRYRFSGLPAGEYLVRCILEIKETLATYVFGLTGSSSVNILYSLGVFRGNAFRAKDAQTLKIDDGEDIEMIDITMPLSKMRSITGTIIEQETGHVVNAGKVALIYTDDGSELASAEVMPGNSEFHFDFVPEGTYQLVVRQARDVTREIIQNPEGYMPPSQTIEKAIRTYGTPAQDIVVVGDLSNITVPVIANVK